MSDTPNVILIAINSPEFAEHMQKQLKRELNQYEIRIAGSCREVEQTLRENAAADSAAKIRWLIIHEHLTVEAEGTSGPQHKSKLAEGMKSSAVKLAERWSVEDCPHPEFRCILLTQSVWHGRPMGFHKRFLGLQEKRLSPEDLAITLADMIDAGDAENTYMVPMVLDVEMKPSPTNADEWQIRFCDFDRHNHLAHFAKDSLILDPFNVSKADLTALFFKIDPTDATGTAFGDMCEVAKDLGNELFGPRVAFPRPATGFRKFAKSVIKFVARWLGFAPPRDQVEPSLPTAFQELIKVLKDIRLACWNSAEPPPPFIHLHIRCTQDGLANPLEIALHPVESYQHLVCYFPLVWNLAVGGVSRDPFAESNEIRVWNQTHEEAQTATAPATKGHFAAGTSCEQAGVCAGTRYEAIPENKAHIEAVSKRVHGEKDDPQGLIDRNAFFEFLKAGSESYRKRRYVLSHGWHNEKSPGLSGIIIGSDLVTIDAMKAAIGPQTLAFFFVNCCDLGQLATRTASKRDYFGGFAAGAIARGITTEVIANRWAVEQSQAKELAVHFWNSQPRTTHSRATALFHARNRVRNDELRHLTWLAPIHAIRGS